MKKLLISIGIVLFIVMGIGIVQDLLSSPVRGCTAGEQFVAPSGTIYKTYDCGTTTKYTLN